MKITFPRTVTAKLRNGNIQQKGIVLLHGGKASEPVISVGAINSRGVEATGYLEIPSESVAAVVQGLVTMTAADHDFIGRIQGGFQSPTKFDLGGGSEIFVTTSKQGGGGTTTFGLVDPVTEDESAIIKDADVQGIVSKMEGNAAINGIESLLLALACEGVPLHTDAVRRAVAQAVESISNEYD